MECMEYFNNTINCFNDGTNTKNTEQLGQLNLIGAMYCKNAKICTFRLCEYHEKILRRINSNYWTLGTRGNPTQ